MNRFSVSLLVLTISVCWQGSLDASEQAEADFEQHIRPLLVAKCIKCHGEKKQEGGLRLDSRAAMLKGGETGPAVIPGKPSESLLIEAVKYESFEMPPTGQLPDREIQSLSQWVAAGAVWPEDTILRESSGITATDRQWWAFQPLRRPTPPTIQPDDWSRTPVDQFVLQRLRENDLTPAPTASRETLVRRLYLDLIGLPPTPQQVDAFLQDRSDDAWENLIDQLLDDPRYGEHWARYWLDLVRYSESDGWNQDAYRPHIYRYRDYVVNAFNQDMPYPQFVREQLAGDEIGEDNPDHLAATGFLRLGIYEYNQRDARGHWNDIMNEMTDVAGDVFLGMSMACARCHDHKFDPVLQRDYFKLRAFFEPLVWRDDLTAATQEQREQYQRQLAEWETATQDIRQQIDALLKPYHDKKWESTVDKFPLDIQACFRKPEQERTSWEQQMAYLISRQYTEEGGGPLKSISKEDKKQHDALLKELAKFDAKKPAPLPKVMAATDFSGAPSPTVIPDDPRGEPIPPGYLTVLSADGESEIDTSQESRGEAETAEQPSLAASKRRTNLAFWIGRPDNPLTHRVIVNRIWQQHFGEGIVNTPSDFGHNGSPPSHPELLDWLTTEFIENNWSTKHLHKTILMSAVWRQSATHPHAEQQQQQDPAEQLMWRSRIRRLRAEQIRDAMLLVSGELDSKQGGPSVEESSPRRGLYVKSYRNKTETFLHAFDMAGGLKSVAIRTPTTTPTQSLLMINGDYALGRAKKMATRLAAKKEAPESTIREAIRMTWGREPTSAEMNQTLEFFELPPDPDAKLSQQKLIDFCHVLLNSNEFLYVD